MANNRITNRGQKTSQTQIVGSKSRGYGKSSTIYSGGGTDGTTVGAKILTIRACSTDYVDLSGTHPAIIDDETIINGENVLLMSQGGGVGIPNSANGVYSYEDLVYVKLDKQPNMILTIDGLVNKERIFYRTSSDISTLIEWDFISTVGQEVYLVADVPITTNGAQTIDGVSATNNRPVLLTNQTSTTANGIYIVQTSDDWLKVPDDVRSVNIVYGVEYSKSFWIEIGDNIFKKLTDEIRKVDYYTKISIPRG